MGNTLKKMNPQDTLNCPKKFVDVREFKFHGLFNEVDSNGLILNKIYLPTEVIIHILSFIDPNNLLELSLVCKNWCNIIKSNIIWKEIYKRHYPKQRAKNVPWYVYYNYFTTNNYKNLIKNGNGQMRYEHWEIVKNFGDEFKIENPPVGVDPLPGNVPDFNGAKSCFATSFYECNKIQKIILEDKRLLQYIINKYKPDIYVSEWISGRFDCACIYQAAICAVYNDKSEPILELDRIKVKMAAGECVKWKKVEMNVKDYIKEDILHLIFEHEGHDTQFWKGHYGSKMAGAVVKFQFDTIGD